jgi:LytS/YehU family sensor histidine kinase
MEPYKQKGKREDSEAQLEILRNVKIFLTDKLQKSEEALNTLHNDVEILKNYLRIEKQAHAKT